MKTENTQSSKRMIWLASCYPCFCSMSTNLWYSKHHSISIVVKYSLTMFYPYLHSTKTSFLTFIKQPCCFYSLAHLPPSKTSTKNRSTTECPYRKKLDSLGSPEFENLPFFKFFGFKGCWRLTKTKTPGAPVVSS